MALKDDVFTQLASLELTPFDLENEDGSFQIFPSFETIPEKESYPSIVYELTDYQRGYGLDGPDGLPSVNLKVHAVALTFDDAATVADMVIQAFDGTRGTWGNTSVKGIFLEQRSTDHFIDAEDDSIEFFTDSCSFQMIYEN